MRHAQAAAQAADPSDESSHLQTAGQAINKARTLLDDDPDEATRAVITKAETVLNTVRARGTLASPPSASPPSSASHIPSDDTGSQPPDEQSLAQGATGDPVRTAQQLLRSHGTTVQATGQFDTATTAAVRNFQGAHQLPITGVIDATTWAALRTSPPIASQPIVASPPLPQRPLLPPEPASTAPSTPLPPAPPPQAAPAIQNYRTVVRGDSISKIAGDTGVSPERLRQLNSLPNSMIYVGEQLRLNDHVPNKIHRAPVTRHPTNTAVAAPPSTKDLHDAPISDCAVLPLPVAGTCYSNR